MTDNEDKGELPLLTKDMLQAILGKLRNACESLDMDSMEEARDELKAHAWSDEDSGDLQALCEAIDGMDVISCEEILGRL